MAIYVNSPPLKKCLYAFWEDSCPSSVIVLRRSYLWITIARKPGLVSVAKGVSGWLVEAGWLRLVGWLVEVGFPRILVVLFSMLVEDGQPFRLQPTPTASPRSNNQGVRSLWLSWHRLTPVACSSDFGWAKITWGSRSLDSRLRRDNMRQR